MSRASAHGRAGHQAESAGRRIFLGGTKIFESTGPHSFLCSLSARKPELQRAYFHYGKWLNCPRNELLSSTNDTCVKRASSSVPGKTEMSCCDLRVQDI